MKCHFEFGFELLIEHSENWAFCFTCNLKER